MARLSLATRAARYGPLLSSEQLSIKNRGERDKLLRAMGISQSQWNSYALSTRRKYLAAAKRGNTATQERARVREQRKARPKRERSIGVSKRQRIEALRQQLLKEGMDTSRGLGVDSDDVDSEVLLSKEAIEDHIRYYGIDYVLKHLEDMWDSVDNYLQNNRVPGNRRWRVFKATPKYRTQDDERWFWYHPSLYAMSG